MSVLGAWLQDGIPDGWSPLAGQVKSAFAPDLEVMGSSTGSAVAVSAGMCPVAIGEESNGSIVSVLVGRVTPLE